MTENTELILDLLREELCTLAQTLATNGITLYVGGGYGLLLRQRHIVESADRTLRPIPPERSTQD